MPALQKWIAAQSVTTILELASNPRTLPKVLEEIWHSAHFNNEVVQVAIASNPSTPSDILAKIRFTRNLEAVMAIASNPSTPDHILWDMLQDEELIASDVEKLIVENPGVSRHTLRLAIQDLAWENEAAKELAIAFCDENPELEESWEPKTVLDPTWSYFVEKSSEILGHLYIDSDGEVMFTYRGLSTVTQKDDVHLRTKVMRMTIKAFKDFRKQYPNIKLYCSVEKNDGREGDRIRLYKKLGFTSIGFEEMTING